jgi:hypothetical protein
VSAARAAAMLAGLSLATAAVRPDPGDAGCRVPHWREGGGPTRLPTLGCEDGEGPALSASQAAVLLFGLRLDPNRAGVRALEALPGIGPARALELARAARERPFCSLADLGRVPGIGPRTLARLEPWVAPACSAP